MAERSHDEDRTAVDRFWQHALGDRERLWLAAAFGFWLVCMVALILGWIPTG